MGMAVIYTCITVPLNIGFDLEEGEASAGVGHLVDSFFSLDILLTFRTAILLNVDHLHGGDGRINTVPWDICVAYLRGGFLLDLVSTLPFDAMAEASAAKLTRVIRLVRLTRLLKLGRVAKLSRLLPALNKLVVRHPSEFNITSTLMQMTFLMHLLACAFAFVLNIVDEDKRPWWAAYIYDSSGNLYLPSRWSNHVEYDQVTNTTKPVLDADFGTKYLAAFYWAASTASTTGVGDIYPATDSQRAFSAIAIIVGVVFCAYILGSLAAIITTGASTAYTSVLSDADAVCRETGMPPQLRRSITAYYRTRVAFTSPFDWKALISNVPFTLHKDVIVYLHEDSPVLAALTGQQWLPAHVACFDRQLIYDVALASEPRWAERGEAIAFQGDPIEEVLVVETSELDESGSSAPPALARVPSARLSQRSVRNFAPSAVLRKQVGCPPAARRSPPDMSPRRYEVFGLPMSEAGARWSEDFIVQHLIFYWTVSLTVLRELAARYPEVAAAIFAGADAQWDVDSGPNRSRAEAEAERTARRVVSGQRGEGVGELPPPPSLHHRARTERGAFSGLDDLDDPCGVGPGEGFIDV
jgi:hypothetical protein